MSSAALITNPIPVLQQNSSTIFPNPFVPVQQQQKEMEQIQAQANVIVEQAYASARTSSIRNLSLQQIARNIANSVVGFVDDMFKKPPTVPWPAHIQRMLEKEQRYAYIGIIFVAVAFYLLLLK